MYLLISHWWRCHMERVRKPYSNRCSQWNSAAGWDGRRRWLNTSTAIWAWPTMYFSQDFFNLESCFVFCALLYGASASTRSWEASSYPLKPCVRFPGPPRPNCWIIDSSLVYLLQDTRSSNWFMPCGPPLVDECWWLVAVIGIRANGTSVPLFWKKRRGTAWKRILYLTFLISFNVQPRRTSYIAFAIHLRPLHCCSWCLASDGSPERRLFVLEKKHWTWSLFCMCPIFGR